jgi:hypothetical protein
MAEEWICDVGATVASFNYGLDFLSTSVEYK